jgi:signal transduction histidine kinase
VGDRLDTQTAYAHFEAGLPALAATLDVIDLTGLSMVELKRRVAALPDRSAILYTAVYSDGAGTYFPPAAALEMISAVANRPIIGAVETLIGPGATGGYVAIPAIVGREAAELALRVLDGEDASAIPIAVGSSLRPVFDWRQLERWGVDASTLPPDSEVRYRPMSLWEQYPWQTALAGIVLILQGAMIVGLLNEHRLRRKAELDARSRMSEIAHMNRFATAGELSAQIAHEVNQPLGAILSNAETAEILLDAPEPDIAEVKDILADIKRDDHRASEIIVRLRRLLKRAPLEASDVDLNDIVREVFSFASAQASARQVVLEELTGRTPIIVKGDPIQLQQVVLNLVSNAIDATSRQPEGHRQVSGRTRLQEGMAEVSIEDSGPGIDPSSLKRVFDRFFTTKEQGMGLGLPIAQTIIEAHGGTIVAENRPEGGAAFRARLPLMQPREG